MLQSETRLGWNAPKSWLPPSNDPLCCKRAGFYQIAQTSTIYSIGSSKIREWHHDPIRSKDGADVTDLVRGGLIDPASKGRIGTDPQTARLRDTPGHPRQIVGPIKIVGLKQEFESCVICTDKIAARYLEILGCIRWEHSAGKLDERGKTVWKKAYVLHDPYRKYKIFTLPGLEGPAPRLAD